jgi:nucleotide-binding universal stress UspA family protein
MTKISGHVFFRRVPVTLTMDIKKILICTDGEKHSAKAEDCSISLAKQYGAQLVALYVVNPFLKKFTNEIYAVNRDECRDHLDRELSKEGKEALSNLKKKAAKHDVQVIQLIMNGSPEEIIVAEAAKGKYDMVILGAKLLRKWKERFESFNLPEKVFRDISVPVLFVR